MKIPIASPLFGFEEWDFEENDTIAIMKNTLSETLESDPSNYLLIFGGKILEDETQLKDLNFKKTPFIYIHFSHEEEEEESNEENFDTTIPPEVLILNRLLQNGFSIPSPEYFNDRDNFRNFIALLINAIQETAPDLEQFLTSDPEVFGRLMQIILSY